MTEDRQKEFFTPFKSIAFLLGIIVLACVAHINFFLHDARPCIDHDWSYFSSGHLAPVVFIYKLIMFLAAEFFSKIPVGGLYIYKICNIFLLIPSVFCIYFSSSFLYNRFAGIFAAFLFISQPEILNVFRKSGVNIVTIFLFSAMVLAYIRSDFCRKLVFSLITVLFGVLLFLHHHSSLLYLTCSVSVFFVFSYNKAKNIQVITKNIRICMILCLIFLSVDISTNFLRYREYFKTALDYFNAGFKGESVSFLDTLLVFFLRSASNLKQMYNYHLFHFNFYGIFVLSGLIFYFINTMRCLKRKDLRNFVSLMEIQFFVVAAMIILVLSTGICHTPIFIAPVYVLLIILNSGIISRLQNICKDFMGGRIFLFLFTLFVFSFGCLSLFYPQALVKPQIRDMMYYIPSSDNLNVDIVRDFYRKKKEGISNFALIPATPYDEASADLLDFYFAIDIGFSSDYASSRYDYLLVLYNLYEYDNPHRKIFLPEIEEKVRHHILAKPYVFDDKQLSLERIVPFRWLTHKKYLSFGFSEQKENTCARYSGFAELSKRYPDSYRGTAQDLVPERACLLFIYTLK